MTSQFAILLLKSFGISRTEITTEHLQLLNAYADACRRETQGAPMTKGEIASALAGMRYSDLVDIGRDLYDMTQSDDGKDLWDLSRKDEWSQVLYNWADANATEDQPEVKAA